MVVMYCCYTQGMIPPFRQAQYTHCNTLRPRATTGTTRTQAPPLMDELLFILSLSNNSSFNHNPFSVRWIYMSCILPGSIEEIQIALSHAHTLTRSHVHNRSHVHSVHVHTFTHVHAVHTFTRSLDSANVLVLFQALTR